MSQNTQHTQGRSAGQQSAAAGVAVALPSRVVLSDAQWAVLAPLLPPQKPRTGKPNKDHRLVVEGMLWILRTGAPWRDLPSAYGPSSTVANRFYRWWNAGVWARVLSGLQAAGDARGELDWLLQYLDGTVVRAHQHAAGAKKGALLLLRPRPARPWGARVAV
jgi:transposase